MKKRLGGKGLSLESFVAAKSKPVHKPKKKNREFYQNVKKIQEYKKLKRSLDHPRSEAAVEEKNGGGSQNNDGEGDGTRRSQGKRRLNRSTLGKIRHEYEKKQCEVQKEWEEVAKQNAERKRARENSEQVRKQTKAKMLKKTSRGQPVMKHRLEHILHNFETRNS